MTFTTFTFLVFLATVFSVYWLLKGRTARNILLVAASYGFYAWWDYRFCILMLISTLVDFGAGIGIDKARRPALRKLLLLASVLCNLGMLGFFKYFNFFSHNFVQLADSLGFNVDYVTLRIVLPVGISFYTFQTMSYTIDIYRGKMRATTRIIDYAAYVSFFPQLVAGPIERATNLLGQFTSPRRFHQKKAVDGLREILWGLFKKMVIADNLATIVDTTFANYAEAGGVALVLATVCFAFQIYYDFSAYSHIAIGTARLFGFELMRNFAHPYFSQSLTEFWRRWHISLSTWFRDYVYIPLGGSRVSRWRRILNVMLTFTISGLWHGASWNFAIWGGVNGAATLMEGLWRKQNPLRATDCPAGKSLIPSLASIARILMTFTIICVTWIFFRVRRLPVAIDVFRSILRDVFATSVFMNLYGVVKGLTLLQRLCLLALFASVLAEWIHRAYPHPLHVDAWPRPLRWALYTLLVWGTLLLSARDQGEFIYFQF